jgi:hypothetical protein
VHADMGPPALDLGAKRQGVGSRVSRKEVVPTGGSEQNAGTGTVYRGNGTVSLTAKVGFDGT